MSDCHLQRLSAHVVWMPPGPPDRPSLCAVTGERGTLMLDAAASDEHARLFLAGLDELGVPRPRLAALTHWHWDHVFGAAEIGAPVISGALTARELSRLAEYDWSDAALDARVSSGEEIAFCADNLKLELPAPRHVRVTVPEILFESSLRVDLGGVTCWLRHVGGDHSIDSVVMFIEPDRVLFLGDCLYDDIYAPTRHFTPARLFPMLDALNSFTPEYTVQGHSPVVLTGPAYQQEINRLRHLGQLAEAHPGDAPAISAAYQALTGLAPDDDTAELIICFASAPV